MFLPLLPDGIAARMGHGRHTKIINRCRPSVRRDFFENDTDLNPTKCVIKKCRIIGRPAGAVIFEWSSRKTTSLPIHYSFVVEKKKRKELSILPTLHNFCAWTPRHIITLLTSAHRLGCIVPRRAERSGPVFAPPTNAYKSASYNSPTTNSRYNLFDYGFFFFFFAETGNNRI